MGSQKMSIKIIITLGKDGEDDIVEATAPFSHSMYASAIVTLLEAAAHEATDKVCTCKYCGHAKQIITIGANAMNMATKVITL